ncbi:MAG TPA: hypothetical protein VMU22_10110 [Rhizomicrobium sp.]|nr:hypothetical protein [Rhizomicrobium sp.]
MSKYDALGEHLRKQTGNEVPMTFAEIEKVVGCKLPRSAYEHRPWWSNNGSNSVMTKVWLKAGFRSARVDMAKKRLVFERAPALRGMAEEPKMFEQNAAAKLDQHPIIGSMKGTFTIEPGWDLTKPALDPEELELWNAKLDRIADELEQHLSGRRK